MIKKIFSKIIPFIYLFSKRKIKKYNKQIKINQLNLNFKSRNAKYKYFHHYFWNIAPEWLRKHRKYFSQNQRGFGEDAFHAMWYFIFNEFKPKNILEIGIYRGQTLSLFALLSKKFNINTNIHGISPFASVGDSVSKYLENIDYYSDVKKNFAYFNLKPPFFHKGLSTAKAMINLIQSQKWDLIYIDGNHDYEIVKHDFTVCSKQLNRGGLIVLDDASLYTDYKPSLYSTAGHPGPSKVALEIDSNLFDEILAVGHNRVFRKII